MIGRQGVSTHGNDRHPALGGREQGTDEIAAVAVRQAQVEQDDVVGFRAGPRNATGACALSVYDVAAPLEQVLHEVCVNLVVFDQQDAHKIAAMIRAEPPLLLVVDDDPRARELLQLLLRADGYRVTAAADGPTALAAIESQVPRVVLLDLVMPGMDGLEVCRRARRSPAGRQTALVVLSGMDDADTRRNALAAGVDAILAKPVDRRELRACLARLCTER